MSRKGLKGNRSRRVEHSSHRGGPSGSAPDTQEADRSPTQADSAFSFAASPPDEAKSGPAMDLRSVGWNYIPLAGPVGRSWSRCRADVALKVSRRLRWLLLIGQKQPIHSLQGRLDPRAELQGRSSQGASPSLAVHADEAWTQQTRRSNLSHLQRSDAASGFFPAERGTQMRSPSSSWRPWRSIGPSISSSTSGRIRTRNVLG